MGVTRPSQNPLWDTNDTNTTDPGPAKRLDGYAFQDELPSDEHNWLQKAQGDWIDFMRRNSVYSTIPEGIGETQSGDVFRVSGDFVAGYGVLEGQVPNTAGAFTQYIDADGDYFAWVVPGNLNQIRLRRFDDASEILITVPAAESVLSMAMDGLYIYVTTSGPNVRACDYTGTWLAVQATPAGSTILDCKRGHVLISEGVGVWHLRNSALVSVATAAVGSGILDTGLIADSGPVCDVLICEQAIGPIHNFILYDTTPAIQWVYTATAAGNFVKRMTIDGPYVHSIIDGAVDILLTFPAGNTPTAERAVNLPATYLFWAFTPFAIYAWSAASISLSVFGYNGVYLGDVTILNGGPAQMQGQAVCDGVDLIYPSYDPVGPWNNVVRHPIGNRGASLRRAAWNEWRPYCHSLAVACGRGLIG